MIKSTKFSVYKTKALKSHFIATKARRNWLPIRLAVHSLLALLCSTLRDRSFILRKNLLFLVPLWQFIFTQYKAKSYYLILFLWIGFASFSFGQGKEIGKVFVGNSIDGKAIMVKWITPEIVHKEGCNIYRKAVGDSEWQQLNKSPILKTTLNILAKDRTDAMVYLEDFVENNEVAEADGLTKLLLSKQFVVNDAFAAYLGIFYEDLTIESGKTYQYKLTQIKAKKEKLIGISFDILARPFQAIDPPKDFTLVPDEKSDTLIHISWLPEEARYFGVEVYRAKENGAFTKLTTDAAIPTKSKDANGKYQYPEFFFSNKDNELGNSYQYHLKGIDFFGRESKASENKEWTAIDRSPAPVPTDLEAIRFKSDQVLLTWVGAPEAKNLKGYNIWMGRKVTSEFTKVNPKLLTRETNQYLVSFSETGDYFFYIEALNKLDQPSTSFTTGLTISDNTPPAAPQAVKAVPRAGFIDLSWTANTEADFAGYIVFRSSSNQGAPFVRITPDAFIANQFTDKLPKEAKNTFFYKIAAIDTISNMSVLSELVQTAMPDVIAPVAPTIIKVKVENSTAKISWLPTIDDDLKGYTIYRSINKDSLNWTSVSQATLDPNQRQYSDEKLKAGVEISYKIIAEDNTGNRSVASNVYTIQTAANSTEASTTDKLTANYNSRKKVNTIKWKKTEESGFKGNILFRKSENGAFRPITKMMHSETKFKDTKVVPGKKYQYQLRTYYTQGKIAKSSLAVVEIKFD